MCFLWELPASFSPSWCLSDGSDDTTHVTEEEDGPGAGVSQAHEGTTALTLTVFIVVTMFIYQYPWESRWDVATQSPCVDLVQEFGGGDGATKAEEAETVASS